MSRCPSPITDSNFPQVWRYAVRKHRHAKKAAIVRNITLTVSQILYFSVFLVLTFGYIWTHAGPALRQFIERFPTLIAVWKQLSAFIFALASNENEKLLCSAGFLYLLPLAISVPIALLTYFCYYPAHPALPETPVEKAQELRNISRYIRVYQQQKPDHIGDFFGIIFAIITVGFAIIYVIDDAVRSMELGFVSAQSFHTNFHLVVGCLWLFIAYKLMGIPLMLLLRPLHYCHVSESLYQDCKNYHRQARDKAPLSPAVSLLTVRKHLAPDDPPYQSPPCEHP